MIECIMLLHSEFDHMDFFSFLREGAQIQLFSHYSFLSVRRPRESIFTFQILLLRQTTRISVHSHHSHTQPTLLVYLSLIHI